MIWILLRVYQGEVREGSRTILPPRSTVEGVFSTEDLCLAGATDERDVIMPLELDVRLPEEIAYCAAAYWAVTKRPELSERRAV